MHKKVPHQRRFMEDINHSEELGMGRWRHIAEYTLRLANRMRLVYSLHFEIMSKYHWTSQLYTLLLHEHLISLNCDISVVASEL